MDTDPQLLEGQKRRHFDQAVYPLEHTNELEDFDNWNYMFLAKYYQGLSMLRFEEPPSMVLDLGCGGGLWAIDAAKQWKRATIYGFDINDMQPRSEVIEAAHPDVASRVKWVHGNFLNGLPFPSEYFDFVRVAGIGLGVPGDEWPFILEEVSRVLRPGCPFEIIEEDLIFPCARLPKPQLPPIIVDVPQSHAMHTTLPSPLSSHTHSSETRGFLSSSQSLHSSTKRHSTQDLTKTQNPSNSTEAPKQERQFAVDPRDHSKLKACWEAMLAKRCIAPHIINVLPFYLAPLFQNIQSHPSLHIPLPPNSRTRQGGGDLACRKPGDEVHSELFFGWEMSESEESGNSRDPGVVLSSWSSMHLAKNARTVMACKRVMWEEWEALYGEKPALPPVVRTSRLKEMPKNAMQSTKTATRDEFELAWSNWEKDITDRIGARNLAEMQFAWRDPPDQRPKLRSWLETQESQIKQDHKALSIGDFCRIVQGFVCWKPS